VIDDWRIGWKIVNVISVAYGEAYRNTGAEWLPADGAGGEEPLSKKVICGCWDFRRRVEAIERKKTAGG